MSKLTAKEQMAYSTIARLEADNDTLRSKLAKLESALRELRHHDRVTASQVEFIDVVLSNNERTQS